MTPDLSHLDQASNYTGKDRVVVGNGAYLPITHTGTISPTSFLELLDVYGNESLVEELESLKYLTHLGVTIASASMFKRFLSSRKLPSCTVQYASRCSEVQAHSTYHLSKI